MKMKIQALTSSVLALAALTTAGLVVSQRITHQALARELAALPPADGHAGTDAGSIPARQTPPGGGPGRLLKTIAAKSGGEARQELVRQLHLERGGANGDPFKRLAPLLEGLSAKELLAVIGNEPAAKFTLTADGPEGTARQEIDEAIVRLAALRRLCTVAPVEALAVCATGAPDKAADPLLNITALALRERSRANAAAAIRWGKENRFWLPASWPGWVLTDVVNREGLASAAALARQEGVLLAENMGWCDTYSLGEVNTLMTEVDKERAAAPERFADNPLVRKGYRKLAEKVSNTLGFDEGRKFAEKWTVGLPCQEDCALSAVASTLAPDSAAETTEAADWMIGFLPEDRRAAAAESVLGSWSSVNPDVPLQWLAKHADSPWRDPAMAAFCRRLFTYAPDQAVKWASAISDETLRAETLAACGRPG
jgi:hypothetical protein